MKLTPFCHVFLALLFGAATLSPAVAKPPPHNISAANFNVVQNDTGNTVDSVTVTAPLTINDLRVRPGSNRGDYNFQIGSSPFGNAAAGVTMVSISENGRDNGELPDEQKQYAAPAFDGSFTNGLWASINDVSSDRAEMNINCAIAYFRTNDWLCGWLRNTNAVNGGSNTIFTASPGMVLANKLITSSTASNSYNVGTVKGGEFRVSLLTKGYDSRTNPGVLLVNHAKNEGNYASSRTNADGTWEVYVKDNYGDINKLEQDPFAFVFVPSSNTNVVSGKFGLDATGSNAVILTFSGPAPAFAVTNFDTGRFRLTIPGGSPDAGVLILSPEGGYPSNFDNVVSYQADGDGWIIESRDIGNVYPPALESTTNEPVASFVYIPAGTAGVTVTPTNTLITAEFGLTATFNVQLDLAPTNDVMINLSSSNPSEGIVSPASLTFNATNWNIPQTVTITGQDDSIADGPVAYSIILAPIVSADTRYNGLDPADVPVINEDDEQPGITVTPTGGLVTSESGSNATFMVFLNQQPAADVTIGLTSDSLTEGTVLPASLTFNAANWSVPQVVTVTGVDDFRKDGNIAYHILTAPAVSSDPNYNGIKPADVSVINVDNDNPGINWNYVNPLTVIEGGATNYSLSLATQPDTNIVINVSSDPTIAAVTPASIVFTPANWNIPQSITVSGVDNLIADGNVSFSITNTVIATADHLYADFGGAKVIPAVRLDNETLLTLPSGDCIYGLGMPAVGIDGRARLEDADVVTYNNGSVTVTLTTNVAPGDVLAIRNDGTDVNQIGLSDTNVTYAGTIIGSVSGGTNGLPLVILLNENSTLPAVQQLIRSTTFFTTTNHPSRATRFVTVALNDGLGVTVTAGKSLRVGTLRLMQFQEGADFGYGVYHGAADTALSQTAAGSVHATNADLLIDWPDGGTPNESQVLLRFDNFTGTNYWQVPSNAVVVSAQLLININNSGDGGRFFRMLMPWDAASDTWGSLGEGVDQDDLESRSVYESQLGIEDGSGSTGMGIVSVGVTPDVQAWVSGTNNYGWVIRGWPLMTDGTAFSPSGAADISVRPRLRVLWLDQGYSSVSFCQGINGYTNASDTNLRQATPDVNYATETSLWSDANDAGNTNTTQCLLRFDGIVGGDTNQIPPGSLIEAAFLDLPSVGPDNMGDGGRFYAMLQPWTGTTATWNTFGTNGVQSDGVIAAVAPTATIGNATLDPDAQGTLNTLEVTTDVQAWANGSRANYGWAVLPWPGGSNGWGFRSAEFSSLVYGIDPSSQRPQLRVYFTPGAMAIPAVIQPPSINPLQVNLHFVGTANFTYQIWRADNPAGPWTQIGTATADAGGNGNFTDDTIPASAAFYRVIYQ